MSAYTRYQTREHAVSSLRNSYGKELREMADAGKTMAEARERLRHGIDLAVLPDELADKYATSDRAWNRFLNDIIRDAVPSWR